MRALLILPAILAPAVVAGIPDTKEIRRGTFLLKGIPGPEHIAAMRAARITQVICICRDGDPGFDPDRESRALADAGIGFARVSLKPAPTRDDFEMFRMVRNSLPPDARVLVHCTDGNRAAAVTVAWLAAEGLVKPADAIATARQAGVVKAETEGALKAYLKLAP